jgi:hypothetical protein
MQIHQILRLLLHLHFHRLRISFARLEMRMAHHSLHMIIVPEIVPPVTAIALLACVPNVPTPSAVLAAPAFALPVPPSAIAMGEDKPEIVPPVMFTFPSLIVTVGSPSWFNDAAVTSTPVAKVNPRVTVAVIAIMQLPFLLLPLPQLLRDSSA